MKLLMCRYCHDVLKLRRRETRFCMCKKSWGHYLTDGANAEVSQEAIVIGIDNNTVVRAIQAQANKDSGYRTLAAWVMGKDAPRVKWVEADEKQVATR